MSKYKFSPGAADLDRDKHFVRDEHKYPGIFTQLLRLQWISLQAGSKRCLSLYNLSSNLASQIEKRKLSNNANTFMWI